LASTTCGARALAEHGHLIALVGALGVELHACVQIHWGVAIAALGEQREGADCKVNFAIK
jgi:hypothetical protein